MLACACCLYFLLMFKLQNRQCLAQCQMAAPEAFFSLLTDMSELVFCVNCCCFLSSIFASRVASWTYI